MSTFATACGWPLDPLVGDAATRDASGLDARGDVISGDMGVGLDAPPDVPSDAPDDAVRADVQGDDAPRDVPVDGPVDTPAADACRRTCAATRPCGPDGCGGMCGACGPGAACTMSGTCQCVVGRTLCGTDCVDLTSDRLHCGSCENACTGTDECIASACRQPMCTDATRANCDGAVPGCETVVATVASCGTCAARRACGSGYACVNTAGMSAAAVYECCRPTVGMASCDTAVCFISTETCVDTGGFGVFCCAR